MSNISPKLGPYALTECLESGSSVQLWLAEHDGQQVAIRLVVEPGDEFAIARWRSELDTLQALGSKPCLPTILAVFEDEKAFVLELIGEGLDVRVAESVENGNRMAVPEAAALGLAILESLTVIGQVHGSLSPKQVRIGSDGRAVLFGFGTQSDRVQPRYMAPEMSGEGEIGIHTDQWHTAVMVYELVLGRSLYLGDWSETFRQALDGDNAEGLAALSSQVPELATVLLPALREGGQQGYPSHAEMGLALQACLSGIGEAPAIVLDAPTPLEREEDVAELVLDLESEESVATPSLGQQEEALSALPVELDEPTEEEDLPGEIFSEPEPEPEPEPELELEPELEPEPEPEPEFEPPPSPQLERIEIALPKSLLPPSLELEAGSADEIGPLGQGVTFWEEEAFEACEGADPVERGSWWVSRGSDPTELPETLALEEEPEVSQKPVALPEPVLPIIVDPDADLLDEANEEEEDEDWRLEASNLVGSVASLTPDSVLPEQEPTAEIQFNEAPKEVLEPPVLDEMPPVESPEPLRVEVPVARSLELPGREAITEILEEEHRQPDAEAKEILDLPWDQPEVVIPAPPKRLDVAPPPAGTPDILSPRRPVAREQKERAAWEHAWTPKPLSERIARSGLLVLLGMGLAWLVMG